MRDVAETAEGGAMMTELLFSFLTSLTTLLFVFGKK